MIERWNRNVGDAIDKINVPQKGQYWGDDAHCDWSLTEDWLLNLPVTIYHTLSPCDRSRQLQGTSCWMYHYPYVINVWNSTGYLLMLIFPTVWPIDSLSGNSYDDSYSAKYSSDIKVIVQCLNSVSQPTSQISLHVPSGMKVRLKSPPASKVSFESYQPLRYFNRPLTKIPHSYAGPVSLKKK